MTESLTTTSQMQALILASFQRLEADGTLAQLVDKQLQDTMKRVVSDAMGGYSDFGKALEKRLKEQAQVNFEALNLPTYTALMSQLIERAYQQSAIDAGMEAVAKQVQEIFGTDKSKTVKLSAIVKEMRNEHRGEEWEDHKMTLHLEERDTIAFIYLDPEEGARNHECSYHITAWRDRETKAWKIQGVEVKGGRNKTDGTTLRLGSCRRSLETVLVSNFMKGAELEIDCDEDCQDLYFGHD